MATLRYRVLGMSFDDEVAAAGRVRRTGYTGARYLTQFS